MRNQVETQKERFQETSIQPNSMHYVTGGGGGGLGKIDFKIIFLQIQFFIKLIRRVRSG